MTTPQPFETTPVQPIDVSFPLPKNPHTTVHCKLTFHASCSVIHLTTSEPGQSGTTTAPLGSFVYAIPDSLHKNQVLTTTLIDSPTATESATRLSRILARKTQLPVYLSCSSIPSAFGGGTFTSGFSDSPEEELEGLTKIIEEIMIRFRGVKRES